MDRIISKEEEREDPRRDSSIYLRVQNSVNSVVFPQILQELQDSFEYSVFYSVSTRNPVIPCKETILHTELILLREILQLQGSSRVIPCIQGIFQQLLPCLQALHTADSSYKAPYSIPGPYSTSRLPVILPGRNSILHGSQHLRSPYSSSQASSTVLHYRILPGEIGFFPKRVKYCISNTILRSVCSNLLITRNLILSRVLVIPCEDTVHYLQSKLS